ncbi:MAG TPA: hypothetical protein VEY91_08105 [Candidatus Limnocylindria bacterium]|nr:hypothetical protein [Candidatus Limnocylindria bacterium]
MTASSRATPVTALLFAVALASWSVTLVLAWPTYFDMNPASGAVATLAQAVREGRVPGGREGETFLATFYFPPFPILVSGLHRLGLEWKDALRTASVLGGLALLIAVGFGARALGRGWRGSVLAVALLLSTYFFQSSTLGGRADLLAAGLSIGSLALWMRDQELEGWGAPALAAGAFLTKATSVSVPLAVLMWAIAGRRPGRLVRFAVRFTAAALVWVALTFPAGGPTWYVSAIRELVTATPCTWSLARGPAEIVRYVANFSELAVIAALALAMLARPAMRATPLAPYGIASGALALFVMTNYGAGHNHLDELTAYGAMLGGTWVAGRIGRGGPLPMLVLVVGVLSASWRDLVPVIRHTPNPANRRPEVLAAVRDEPGRVFTEDGLLALAAGRTPAIADPGALRSLVLKGDPRAVRVVRDLDEARYDLVVLMTDLDSGAYWYRNFHLGEPIVDAIRRRYRAAGTADGFHFYRPNPPRALRPQS